ncbi:hypothetical protein Tco_0169106, partial [Tanacetum coccineum]
VVGEKDVQYDNRASNTDDAEYEEDRKKRGNRNGNGNAMTGSSSSTTFADDGEV